MQRTWAYGRQPGRSSAAQTDWRFLEDGGGEDCGEELTKLARACAVASSFRVEELRSGRL